MLNMLKSTMLYTTLIVGAAVAVAAPALETQPKSQGKGYRFQTEVEVIPVPVFVTDPDGQPVTGLTIDDFILEEEGHSRPIVIFEPISYDRLSTFKDRAPVHPGLRRSFLLMFDLAFSSSRGILRAREGALDFVTNRLAPTDLVAVATYSNMGGLKLLNNFTTDHQQAARVIDTLGLLESIDVIQDPVGFVFNPLLEIPTGPGTAPPDLDDKDAQLLDILQWLKARMDRSEQDRYRNQAAQYLDQFNELYSAMNSLSGRKIVLFLSQGIDSNFLTGTGLTEMDEDFQKFVDGNTHLINTDNRFGRAELRDTLLDGLKRASGADVMINTLDVSGLGGEAGAPPGKGAGGGQDTLFMMANETGGQFYSNVNNLEEPLQRILKETSHFYLLGFNPRDLKQEGRFRRIDVDVKRDDVRVSARRGYFEPKPTDKLTIRERMLEVSEYVSKDLLSDDVAFDIFVSPYPGQADLARLPVVLKFPGKQFTQDRDPSEVMQLEVFGYAIDTEGNFIDFFNRTLSFDMGKEYERLRRTGVKYYDILLVRPGLVRLKLIARDVQTGKIGSFIEDIDVPDFTRTEFTLTPPLFISAEPEWIVAHGINPANIEPRRQGLPISYPFVLDGNEYIPAVRPSIRSDQPTNVMVRAYNLALSAETGQPQTEMKFRRIDPEGGEETIRSVGLLKQPSQPYPGCFELVFQIHWEETPTGPALLQLTLTDLIAQKQVEVSSPYVLIP
jgi:VWFA-related protein